MYPALKWKSGFRYIDIPDIFQGLQHVVLYSWAHIGFIHEFISQFICRLPLANDIDTIKSNVLSAFMIFLSVWFGAD